ncbi:MAG: hypothetical protein H6673_08240 [Anaerolineales bacterium]|nr:hypothetical protein [Anaerolineales bacterium]
MESNEGVAAQIVAMESYGLGLDYLYRYSDAINSISAGPEISVPVVSIFQ